jgi:hypothetical protein
MKQLILWNNKQDWQTNQKKEKTQINQIRDEKGDIKKNSEND